MRFLVAAVAVVLLGGVVPAAGAKSGNESWSQSWTSDSDHQDFAYALVERTPDGGTLALNGTQKDRDDLLALRKKTDGDFLWIRRGAKRYLVTDAPTVAKAKEIYEPERAMSQAAGELGSLQGDLGSAQGDVGLEQGRIGTKQAQIGLRQAQIALELANGDVSKARRKELEAENDALSEEMERLGRAQSNLGEKQTRMGQDQTKLGEQQSKDAETRTEVYRKVRADMTRLLDAAIASGVALKL